ncbi:Lon protease C-terminal proteolytic domain-containing protein [Collybia nuda]|uniref:Lon protease homolog n=1 Tax=Collybia nuda TaxID=64659 RepID=A0A9P6CPT2_9AGAR|nr:Lon protease C-terminal proteolytic domain-containing protein [Collybia nuda]
MASSRLPVLALPYPLILLPASRLTMPVSQQIGESILALIDESDTLPVVAAIPITNQTSNTAAPVLSEWGTAARVLRLVKPTARNPRQPYLVSIHGLTRIRLIAPTDTSPPPPDLLADITLHDIEYPPTEKTPSRETVDKFRNSAMRLLDRLARDSTQQIRKDSYNKIAGMLDDITAARAPWMADVLIGSINGEYQDKLAVLATPEAEARLKLATDIFLKQASISEVSKKIASAVDESLSKQQKEFFLRQQLAAIQRELHSLTRSNASSSSSVSSVPSTTPPDNASELDDDEQHEADDMADLKRRIEAMEVGSEERKMGVREWRRLKRIPQGSVENGVIRSYLEWLTSVPWPNSNPILSASSIPQPQQVRDKTFLTAARTQLDADHFGLEKIKKRLIEYLAVVRLKEMNAEKEVREEEQKHQAKPSDTKAVVAKAEGKESKAVVPYKNQPRPSPQSGPSQPSRLGKKGVKGPILLFVGPPGTGKTSLGQSVAKALGRPFQRISLGGVRDEAEIRGHRRTYVASGPGLIVQALRKAGRGDAVMLLDEIDKVGQSNFHGDPGAALLEVLDPEQNHTFNDHYINVPIDLSQVLFICTANSLETISAPLLDRCEIIQLSGYTYDEKMHIARRFLLPKQLQANGLQDAHITITEPALLHIATRYTREAGVRSLERAIGGVVRYKAVEWAEFVDGGGSEGTIEAGGKTLTDGTGDGAMVVVDGKTRRGYRRVVEEHEIEKILGIARWDGEEREREERRGIVYGLVVMGQGEGGILPVETIGVPGSGRLKLTGSLGDVIKESGELALSWVKTHAYDLCITNTRAQDPLKVPDLIDIHLHLPSGAQKKDGPSAGIAMTCAFVSLLTGACVPTNTAMTGEITLRGRVTPVGGIKEKVLGAHRAQVTKVILPWANRKDVEHDVALEIRNEMEFVFVRTVQEALEAAFGKNTLGWRRDNVLLESRL